MIENGIWAIPLQLTNFNIVVAVLGGFISLFGLVSYQVKENYYLSEARTSFMDHLQSTKRTQMGLTIQDSDSAFSRCRFWAKWCKLHPP